MPYGEMRMGSLEFPLISRLLCSHFVKMGCVQQVNGEECGLVLQGWLEETTNFKFVQEIQKSIDVCTQFDAPLMHQSD